MEKDDRVAVVPVAMGWSDLGCWHTIHAPAEKDAADNAVTGDAFLHDSRGNLVRAGGKRVSILGMDNIAAKIGRASCRERVCKYVYISVVAVTLQKKKYT